MPDRRRGLRGAFSLIEMVVVIAVIALAAAFILPRYLGGRTLGKTIRSPRTLAREAVCRAYLAQVRQAIEMAKSGAEEDRPPSLSELRLSRELTRCPVGGEEYVYSPQSCAIKCPHPGHESY